MPVEQKVTTFPTLPGVYLFKNWQGAVVYVGKAVNLRARVRSYFTKSGDTRTVTRFIEKVVVDVDYIVTDSEKEALILEDVLIKEHRPKYNVDLKDDKSFLAVKVDRNDRFPRLDLVRVHKTHKAKEKYFGPFHSARSARVTVKLLSKIFQIRRCSDTVFNNRVRPCLDYQIKICPGPCCDLISEGDYGQNVDRAVQMLEGRNRELIREMKAEMKADSDALRYEKAARVRDQIRAVEATVEKQKVVSQKRIDRDVFGLHVGETRIGVQLLHVRNGILSGSREFSFKSHGLATEELLASFLARYYSMSDFVPRHLLLPMELEGAGALAEWLAEKRGGPVELLVPKRGDSAQLVKLATKNAELRADEQAEKAKKGTAMLQRLGERLGLPGPPIRIECYDISHVGGSGTVGSMVLFENAEPKKGLYRKYKIRNAEPGDDYGAMYEVMRRRWTRLLQVEEKEETRGLSPLPVSTRPDLVLVDGGKGQLNVAVAVLHDLGVEGVAVAALAKGGDHTVSKAEETDQVFVPGRKNPVKIRSGSEELFLLQRVRDESHRFAITYQRKLRGKSATASVLDEIAGVGPTRRIALLKQFGSAEAIAKAAVEQIAAVKGIGLARAEQILAALRRSGLGH